MENKLRSRNGQSLRIAGFIAVGCLTLLATFTVACYPQSDVKMRQSEARTIATGIYEAEMGYFSVSNSFSDDPAVIGFEPASTPKYYKWKIEVYDCSETGCMHYRARVWGNIDDDPTEDVWEGGDRARTPENTVNDVVQ